MRTMMRVHIPVGPGNKAIKENRIAKVVGFVMDKFRPECAYFYPQAGKRTMLFVFDLKDPSQIPMIAEQFFHELDGEIEMIPVMNADDLKKGLESLSMA